MDQRRALAAFFLSLLITGAALAQTEFGSVSGGTIDLITKHPQRLSGSLSLSASRSPFSLGSGSGRGYGATLGGTLVRDRVWFFASAEKSTPLFGEAFARAIDAKMTSQLGDRQNLAASFATSTGSTFTAPIPSSFLSLHYTGVVSNNMFVTASFSELKRN